MPKYHSFTNFKESLLCLLSFYHVIWNSFGGKFIGQQESILHPKDSC
jgi:hypothetical protein